MITLSMYENEALTKAERLAENSKAAGRGEKCRKKKKRNADKADFRRKEEI